jgi:hypothetical protein
MNDQLVVVDGSGFFFGMYDGVGVAVAMISFASFVKQTWSGSGGRKEKAELSNYFTDKTFFDDDGF